MNRAQSRAQARSLKRRLKRAFTERLALKATALAMAVVLWFTVRVREPAEQMMSVIFLPALEPGVALAEQPGPIRALVYGSGRDLLKLYATPPVIRMSIGGEVGDSLVVALRPSDIDMPPGVSSAVVRDVQPRRITLVFRRVPSAQGGPSDGAAWARPITTNPPTPDTAPRSTPVIVAPVTPGTPDTTSRVIPDDTTDVPQDDTTEPIEWP